MGLNVAFFEQGNAASLVDVLRSLLNSPVCRQEQAFHNLNAVYKNRLEVIGHAYLKAFNLALEISSSSKRLAIPPLPQSEPV